jgi:uncharacterized membrane protein
MFHYTWVLFQGNYFIAFVILSNSMEDPTFNLKGIHIVNVILQYFYLGLLIMCFILALGNRPQGSKLGYTLAFIGFALVTVYMTVGVPSTEPAIRWNIYFVYTRWRPFYLHSRASRTWRRSRTKHLASVIYSQTRYSGILFFRYWQLSGYI